LEINGFLNVFKDKSRSSFEIVDIVKKMFKDILDIDIKVGHLGTLDPCAVGVLPMAIGKATRLCEFMENNDKKYFFELTLGIKTTTGDQEGDVLDIQTPPIFSDEKVMSVCSEFIGYYKQKIPSYSAAKIDGKRFYELARANQTVPERYKDVNIKRLHYIKRDKNSFWFEVVCSFGTYIRSLCEDIASRLGTIGTMTYLLREASGSFFLKDSLSLENLEYLISKNEYFKILISVNKMLSHIPVVILNYDNSRRFVNGGEIWINKDFEDLDILRVFCTSGTFLGLAERHNGSKKIWKPNKVIVI